MRLELSHFNTLLSLVKHFNSDIVKFKTLPEYPTAICMKVYGPYARLRESYLELFAEISKMGYEIVGAPRTCYIDGIWNQEDPEKWLTVIQVPVLLIDRNNGRKKRLIL